MTHVTVTPQVRCGAVYVQDSSTGGSEKIDSDEYAFSEYGSSGGEAPRERQGQVLPFHSRAEARVQRARRSGAV